MKENNRFVEIPGRRLKRLNGRYGGDAAHRKSGDVVPRGPEQGSKRVYHRRYRTLVKRQLKLAVDQGSIVLADIREMSSYKWFGCYMS